MATATAKTRFPWGMNEDLPLRAGPRLSSIAGLKEANLFDSLLFDPIAGVIHVIHTPDYIEILRSGMLQFADPGFLGALVLDDPIAMRIWVEATAARLAEEARPDEAGPPNPTRDPKALS